MPQLLYMILVTFLRIRLITCILEIVTKCSKLLLFQTTLLKQHALRTRHLALAPHDRRARHAQRDRQRLEGALGAVVVVVAADAVDVHRDARALREAVQAVRDHLAAQVADLLAAQVQLADAVGPVREVDDRARQGFVQRAVGGAEAGEAGCCVEGGFEGLEDAGLVGMFCFVLRD